MDIFEELNKKGHTIVLITHDEDIAARAKESSLLWMEK